MPNDKRPVLIVNLIEHVLNDPVVDCVQVFDVEAFEGKWTIKIGVHGLPCVVAHEDDLFSVALQLVDEVVLLYCRAVKVLTEIYKSR